jgi:hypothetical protein
MKGSTLRLINESLKFKHATDWGVLFLIPLLWLLKLIAPYYIAVPLSVFFVTMLSYRLEAIHTSFQFYVWTIRCVLLSLVALALVYSVLTFRI